jgi:hypothetical protein
MNRSQVADELQALIDRVRRNMPKSHNPDAFHEEKSEIANDLHKIVMHIRSDKPIDR